MKKPTWSKQSIQADLKLVEDIDAWMLQKGYFEDNLFEANGEIFDFLRESFPDLTKERLRRVFEMGTLQAAIYDANEGERWKSTLTKGEILMITHLSL